MAAPAVTTVAVSPSLPGGIILNGTLDNDGGQACQTKFQYGLTDAYGSETALVSTAVGAFSATLTGLQPGVTYHYRAVAVNADGTTYGADGTFTLMVQESAYLFAGNAGDIKPTGVPLPTHCWELDIKTDYVTKDGTNWVAWRANYD